MSVAVSASSTDQVDYGDVAAIGGLTGFTLALTIDTAQMTGRRLVTQWGSSSSERAFVCEIVNANEFALAIRSGGSTFGRKTTVFNATSGTLYRLVFTWTTGTPNVIEIWVDGVSQGSLATWIGNTDLASIKNATTNLQVGYESDEALAGLAGDYSEFAIWDHVVPDWVAVAYGKGFSPAFYRNGGILYDKLGRTASRDVWGGIVPTHTGTAVADHPRVIYPAGPQIISVPAAAAGQTITLVPVIINLSAVALGVTKGSISRAVTPCQGSFEGVGSGLQKGAISRAVTPSQGSFAGLPLGLQLGALAKAIVSAEGSLVGVAPGLQKGAISRSLAASQGTFAGVPLGVLKGALTKALSPSLGSFSAIGAGIQKGGITRAVTPADATFAAVPVTVSNGNQNISVASAQLTIAGQAVTLDLGPLSLAVVPAVVSAQAVGLPITRGAILRAVMPAAMSIVALAPTVNLGALNVVLSPADAALVAQALGVSPGAISKALASAVMTFQVVGTTTTPLVELLLLTNVALSHSSLTDVALDASRLSGAAIAHSRLIDVLILPG